MSQKSMLEELGEKIKGLKEKVKETIEEVAECCAEK